MTLEAPLRGKLDTRQPAGLSEVTVECRRQEILDQRQEVVANSVKSVRDHAAHSHGDRVPSVTLNEQVVTQVLFQLRKLIEGLY
jgi:hypothetical protein